MNGDLAALAADAYVYGFPLVFDVQEVDSFLREGMGSVAPAPFNSFSHASKLAGPEERFVSINNDTIYSIAQVDVSGGPVLLQVPDTAGRYYVLQFIAQVWQFGLSVGDAAGAGVEGEGVVDALFGGSGAGSEGSG